MDPDPSSPPITAEQGTDLAARIALGRRHRSAGELDDAVEVFTDAHRAFPSAAEPLVERGAILVLQGRYRQTLTDYHTAAKLYPHYPGLDSYIAELYLYTGRPAEALALSEDAAVREPANLMHRINIAHAQLLLGHTELALDGYRRQARQFHPTKKRFGRDLALQDLRLLVAAGVDIPQLVRARDALTAP
jgi:tetratricopeptide (TPR) repeat protein